MVARGSAAREDMMQTLEKVTAEMGRMILDLHRLKREKLEFLTTKSEGGPIVKRCLMKDLRDPLTDKGLAESGLYTVDFDNIQAAATAQYLGDCFPETLSEKYLYDCLVVKTPEGGEEMVYGRDQLEKLLKQPAVDCTESFTLAVGITGKSGAEICKQIKLNVGMMVQIKCCPVWEYVVRAPDLPWPWIELAKRDDLTLAIYDKLRNYLAEKRIALSSNKSADIWKILRADRDAHNDQSAWKTLWSWRTLVTNPFMSVDDYGTFYDEFRRHRRVINMSGVNVLDIVLVDLKRDPASAKVWNWTAIWSNRKLTRSYLEAMMVLTGKPGDAGNDLSRNRGPGIWEVLASPKMSIKGKSINVGEEWKWNWRELSCNPYLDVSLFRLYKTKVSLSILSSNETRHIWDIVNEVPETEGWDWKKLSSNKYVTIGDVENYKARIDFAEMSSNETTDIWAIVDKFPNESWDWKKLSSNKYMTLVDFEKYKTVIDVDKLSENSGENVPTILVKHPELPWSLDKLCRNKHLSLAVILETRDKLWKLPVLAENGVIPAPFFRKAFSGNEQEQQRWIDSYLQRRAIMSESKGGRMREALQTHEDRSVSFKILSSLVCENSKIGEKPSIEVKAVKQEDRSASFFMPEESTEDTHTEEAHTDSSSIQNSRSLFQITGSQTEETQADNSRNQIDQPSSGDVRRARINGQITTSSRRSSAPAIAPAFPPQQVRTMSLPPNNEVDGAQDGEAGRLTKRNAGEHLQHNETNRVERSILEQSRMNAEEGDGALPSPLVVASRPDELDVASQPTRNESESPQSLNDQTATATSGNMQDFQQSHENGVEGGNVSSDTSLESPSSPRREGEGAGTGSFPLVVASHADESNVTRPPAENEREPSNDGDSAPVSGDLQEPEQNHANGVVEDDGDSSDSSDVSSQVSSDSPISENLQEEAQSGHRGSVGELTHAFKNLDVRTKHDKDFDKRINAMVKDQQERDENRWMPRGRDF